MFKKKEVLLTAVRGYLTVDLTKHKGHMIIECEVVYPLGSTNVLWQALEKVRTDGGRREKLTSSPKIFTILLANGITKARFIYINQHLLFCACSIRLGPVSSRVTPWTFR